MPPLGESRAAAWRMANVDLRNLRYDPAGYGNPQSELRYDSGGITRGRHARRLRYKIMSARMDLISSFVSSHFAVSRFLWIRLGLGLRLGVRDKVRG